MNSLTRTLCCLAGLITVAISSSCTHQAPPPPQVVVQPDAYEIFVKEHPKYPKTMSIYRNNELMKQATPSCPIYICLSQQRGRLYVNGKVAADWPVSTGVNDHPTPTGSFRVIEKKREYSSRTWGRIVDADGKCVVRDANSTIDTVPKGGKFIGSPMPNWQRLTSSGIGMHTGKVRAGRVLSHGCIRTPGRMARELFDITATGRTRVTITKDVETCYPTFVGTSDQQTAATQKTSAATEPQQAATPVDQQQPAPAEQLATPVDQQQPTPTEQLATPADQQQPTPVEQQQPAPAEQEEAPTPTEQQNDDTMTSAGGVRVHSQLVSYR